jgi:plastocyanin
MKLISILVVAAVALAAAATASSKSAPKLTGTVGPGFTITLKQGTKPVKTLKAGRYSITVSDRSNIHNFRLRGPGVNRQITTVPARGTKTVTLTIKRGTYTFVCDPHASTMRGTFRVT